MIHQLLRQLVFYLRVLRLLPVLICEIIAGRFMVWPASQKLIPTILTTAFTTIIIAMVGIRSGFMRSWVAAYAKWFLESEKHTELRNNLNAAYKVEHSPDVNINGFIISFEEAWKVVRESRRANFVRTIGLLVSVSLLFAVLVAIIKVPGFSLSEDILPILTPVDKMELGELLVTLTLFGATNYRLRKHRISVHSAWWLALIPLFALFAAVSVEGVWKQSLGEIIQLNHGKEDVLHGFFVFGTIVAIATYDWVSAKSIAPAEGEKILVLWIFGDLPNAVAVGIALVIRLANRATELNNWLVGAIMGPSLFFVVIYVIVELGLVSKIMNANKMVGKSAAAGR
jgi:hypothetical protein